jgi:hypothetical protein
MSNKAVHIFHSRIVHPDIVKVLSPDNAQKKCFKMSCFNVNFNTPCKTVFLCISW